MFILTFINDAAQIIGRGIAFVLGMILIIPSFVITVIVSILCKILWTIAYVPSWISGRLIMFAMDMDPAAIKKQCEMTDDLKAVKKIIEKALVEAKAEEKADDDPS